MRLIGALAQVGFAGETFPGMGKNYSRASSDFRRRVVDTLPCTSTWGSSLSHHFVLSDYENVQFTDAGGFKPGDCRIRVFIGQNQANVPVDLVKALLPFGPDADLLRISGT